MNKILITIIVMILVFGVVDYVIYKKHLPECYITINEEGCIIGYQYRGIHGQLVDTLTRQCCRPPNYLLQGMDTAILNDMIWRNWRVQDGILMYNNESYKGFRFG